MRKLLTKTLLLGAIFWLTTTLAWAQSKQISGTVTSAEGDPLIGVNILVEGTVVGTVTDVDGKFSFTIREDFPVTLKVSMIGYETQTVEVTEDNATSLSITLNEQTVMGQEVVISASRVEESILESPVTVEKMGILAIRNTPAPNFYDGIEDLKGVQMNTSSALFKAVNTRGFATMANIRFVQLIDGMDNAAPGLNFPMGNIVGISELDIESVELVPGAASALYGPNAFNGILLMTSKSPFEYQGLSAMAKGGMTNQQAAGLNPMYEFNARYAKAFNNKFAFKVNFSYVALEDWWATDYSQHAEEDPGRYNTNYNGLNIYGDAIATTLDFDAIAGTPAGVLGREKIARTGYKEVDLIGDDYNSFSMKASVGLNYRLTDKMELSYDYRYGRANAIYQGFSRYVLKNLSMQQHRLELRGDNFFIRGYGSFENAGDAYDSRFLAWNINRTWKSDTDWFTQYATNYIGALLPILLGGGTPTDADRQLAHDIARGAADNGRLEPGTSEFESVKNTIKNKADLATGSKFIDQSRMYHVEGNYNFKNEISWLDLLTGGHYRRYELNSSGTIFNDANGSIPINEYGGYLQASKRVANDRLKLGASVRYDKNENFQGQFSPRAFAVFSLDQERKHNIRASYQTGFRNPDTQSQFIALDLGPATLVGGTQKNLDMYSRQLSFDPANGDPVPTPVTYNIYGSTLYDNAYTASSVAAFSASGDPNDLVLAETKLIQPEQVQVIEVGYKGIFANKFFVDFNFYRNRYTNFQLINTVVVVPDEFDASNLNPADPTSGLAALASQSLGGPKLAYAYQLYTNAPDPVTSIGIGLGLSYHFNRGYTLSGSYNYADFSLDPQSNPDNIPGFNTPKNRYKIQFGNREAFDNFGFNIAYRWSDEYFWTGTFGNGTVPAYSSLDMQLSYRLTGLKSVLKAGATNLLHKEYVQAYGAPAVGSIYYLSLTFDQMFNK